MAKLQFDPKALPVDSYAGESAVLSGRLTMEGLRAHFASPPLWQPEVTDEHRQREAGAKHTPASVLMPVVVRPQGLTMLLTQRTDHLTHHSGQVSLPGGRAEAEDASAIETALREAEEEVGLQRKHVEVVGTLPDYFTGTGYRVTPVVGLVHPPIDLVADPFEVAEIFEVPLAFLMDGMNHQRRTLELPGGSGQRTFYAMPYDRFFIWGATAGMLRNLFHFLRT
ncbi:CoA pyrophosphatase [Herminiimonas sp.]|uniref:CoA pyrophosphatase n=1 Tax=Herminiimonas sp. TaxID=1926289 RepID=UPI002723C6AB|nr:CoA pyrophosphatase [Herminiimonas sp.]MDO8304759.1 CoA pyrophosphatase [Herminiimonas sp.]